MNWGYRVAFLYIAFVVFMLGMVFSAFRYNVNLVAQDYYKKEIAYESEMNKIRNTNALKVKPTFYFQKESKGVMLKMPFQEVQGEIHLYRPTDNREDIKLTLSPDNQGQQFIPIQNLSTGFWRIKLDWQGQNKKYLTEEKIYIEKNGEVKIGQEIKIKNLK
jgi:hypothetical protein